VIYVVVERCYTSIISEELAPKLSVKAFEKLSMAQEYYESRKTVVKYVYPVQSLKIDFQTPLYLLVFFDKDKAEVVYGTPHKKNLEPVQSYLKSTQNKKSQVLLAWS
tara:strand:+ start:202750 stop:203070 length:321 start_codon:yes stop_codon:yes gene_type:complete